MAEIAVRMPRLTFNLGLGYLRMKRQARRSAGLFRAGLVEGGMPEELAEQLTLEYETDLSLSRYMGDLGRGRLSFSFRGDGS